MEKNLKMNLEAYIRGLIREEVKGVIETNFPSPSTSQIRDRIGGISLAVDVTGLAKQTIYNFSSTGRIPHSRVGNGRGKLIFSEAELRSWLLENKRPMVGYEAKNADYFIVKPITRRKKGGAQ